MHKHWMFELPQESGKVAALSQLLGTPDPLSEILVDRKVETFEAAKHFFRPSLDRLHDPFLMEGMDKAVMRLIRALDNGESILIYGDYDVDGTTAVAMVYDFLRQLPAAGLRYYVPDRMIEGYGVSIQAIEKAYKANITLIITLDCGIKSYDPIARAAELGIDVLVCDHHEVGDTLPLAYAILDPKQPTCPYPCKELSGCGIGFKLLQAFCQKRGLPPKHVYAYLDLVAVSTACDIVPLVGENRILVYHGIKQLTHHPRPGLQALIALGKCPNDLTVADIVFKVGPRINAAGRVGHASLAVQLLVEQHWPEVQRLAQALDAQNHLRKTIDETTTQEALHLIESQFKPTPRKSNVLFNPIWHKGVIGIVAARCIEKYYRPTVVLTLSDGKVTGSARSVPGYNIYEAISACSDLLHQYGGHAFAAGLTMPVNNLTDFQEKFDMVVTETISDHLLIPQQTIHACISFQMITNKFVNILMQMAPFGVGNPTPVFVTDQVYAHKCTLLKGEHLKLILYQMDGPQHYDTIGFGLGCYEPLISSGKPFSIAYTIGYNSYFGNRSLQLFLRDIKAEGTAFTFSKA